MRRFQIVWTGVPNIREEICIKEKINIIDTVITPLNTLSRGLQLITQSGDIIVPCKECISKKITDTISYSNLDIISRNRETLLNVTVYILCDGSLGHEAANECSIALYVDY